jgi:hypothetical protein
MISDGRTDGRTDGLPVLVWVALMQRVGNQPGAVISRPAMYSFGYNM